VVFPRDIRYQAAVIRDHHVLLARIFDRSDGREFWIIPGGGREPGETEEECVCREVREETSLVVTAGPLLFETPDIPDGIYGRLKTYLCTVVAGEASPGTEPEIDHDGITTIRALGWFDLRDPAGWDPRIAEARATLPLMMELREVLGYA
jgi:8-oxo-dGTP pyrophosphatase MutT (NUDIX family)